MKLSITPERRRTLLKWLKTGIIDTLDMPEGYDDGAAFQSLLESLEKRDAAASGPDE